MKRILVVDDNEAFRMSISEFLRWRSFIIIEADDGVHGLRLAKEHQPDLILSDVHMPRLNGYEFLKQLREDIETTMIPVIIFSNQDEIEARDYALQLGAVDYLYKPELTSRIQHSISHCLNPTSSVM